MSKLFKTQYQVNLDDLDFMGIVGHPNWVTITERVRTGYFREAFHEYAKEGLGMVVRQINVKYLRSVRFPELLDVEFHATEVDPVSMRVHHEFKNSSAKLCVEAEVTLTFIDATGKPITIPQLARETILVD